MAPSGYTHPSYTNGKLSFGLSGNEAIKVSGFNLAVNETLIIKSEFEFPSRTRHYPTIFHFGGSDRSNAVSLQSDNKRHRDCSSNY